MEPISDVPLDLQLGVDFDFNPGFDQLPELGMDLELDLDFYMFPDVELASAVAEDRLQNLSWHAMHSPQPQGTLDTEPYVQGAYQNSSLAAVPWSNEIQYEHPAATTLPYSVDQQHNLAGVGFEFAPIVDFNPYSEIVDWNDFLKPWISGAKRLTESMPICHESLEMAEGTVCQELEGADPSISAPKNRKAHRKSGKLTPASARRILNDAFNLEPYPDRSEIKSIAEKAGLRQQTVRNWYGNKRKRTSPEEAKLSQLQCRPHRLLSPDNLGELELDQGSGICAPRRSGSIASYATSGSRHSANSSNSRASRKGVRQWLSCETSNSRKLDNGEVGLSYPCSFCNRKFWARYTWARHEEEVHVQRESWTCNVADIDPSLMTPMFGSNARLDACENPKSAGTVQRIFYRKHNLRQHLQLIHKISQWDTMEADIDSWRQEKALPLESKFLGCPECTRPFEHWATRSAHVATHYSKKTTVPDGMGDGLVDDGVESSLPSLFITMYAPINNAISWTKFPS